jgi:hypothetical protein
MAILFRVCRRVSPARWVVMIEGKRYGEYVDKRQALIDAIPGSYSEPGAFKHAFRFGT